MTLQILLCCRQIVALFTSISNKLVNRLNVSLKMRLLSELCSTFETLVRDAGMKRLEMTLKTCSIRRCLSRARSEEQP